MTATTVDEVRVVALILSVLARLDDEGMIDLEGVDAAADTPLFGESGLLDSVGLVSLVVAVEEALDDELGLRVGLADERALSQSASPYRTVSTLARYAVDSVPG